MANRFKLRLTGRPSREPDGITIDQFKIEISPPAPNKLEPGKAAQKRQRRVNAMADVAESATPDVTEPSNPDVTPIPTDPPVGELDSTPIPTDPPVGELETSQPAPIV